MQAAELCHRPAPEALITWYNHAHPQKPLRYSQKDSAIYHPISILRTDQPAVYWIGLAWLAPVSGALFAVRCDGSVIDASPVGAIGKLSAGPVLLELGQSVMFVYVNKETGDCVNNAIQIAALKDNKIISLWEHGYNQGMMVPASGTTPKSFASRNYAVSFSEDQRTLQITGMLATYPYHKDGSQASVPAATQALPAESYHWDASALHFIPEKHYRPLSVCLAE